MKPNRPQSGPEREAATSQPRPKPRKPGQMHIAFKLIISVLVIWHVTAVFLAPMSIPPSSPLVTEIAQTAPIQWYLDLLYINHGYDFFAPDPSNGHLIRYQLFDSGGKVIEEGEFPNKQANWPRLLYHRYFMLADQCQVGDETEAKENAWRDEFLKAYARQLLREHPAAAAARVTRVVHYPLRPEDAVQIQLNPSLEQYRAEILKYPPTYQVESEVTQRRSDVDAPEIPQAAASNWRQDVASGWQGGLR